MYQDRFLNALTSARRSVEDEFLQACESGKIDRVTQLLSEYESLQIDEINGFVSLPLHTHTHTRVAVLHVVKHCLYATIHFHKHS